MSCGAWKFLDSMKLHGCFYDKCAGCGSDLCKHWSYCPRCVNLQKIEAEQKYEKISDLYCALADRCVSVMKNLGHFEGSEPGNLTPEQIEECLRRVTAERDAARRLNSILRNLLGQITEIIDQEDSEGDALLRVKQLLQPAEKKNPKPR